MDTAKPANFPFELSQVTISSPKLNRVATVLTPRNPMVFDWAQLQKIKDAKGLSPVEQWLIENARRSGEKARITILRAVNSSGERVWLFDPTFDNPTLEEAGYILTKALLPFHRAMMLAGVVLMAHSDWGDRESFGIRSGVWRCVDEFRAKPQPTSEEELNRQVLEHMVHHMSLSLDHVVTKILPQHLAMIERRWDRIKSGLVISEAPRSGPPKGSP